MLKNDETGTTHFAAKTALSTYFRHGEVKNPNECLLEIEVAYRFFGWYSDSKAC